MRNLVLILIVFIAVVTFIRAFENHGDKIKNDGSPAAVEFSVNQ
jgi:hypothetical protein